MSPAQDKSSVVMEKSSENSSEKDDAATEELKASSGILSNLGRGGEPRVSDTSSFQVVDDPKD